MIRYRYNQQVAPAAPFVYIAVGRPTDEGSVSDVPAQLDCAADMTVIPWRVAEDLKLEQHDQVETLGFDGHAATVASFLVRLQLHDLEPVIVEVLASRDEPYILLGRDVLNRYRLVLDGPAMILEIG